MLNNDQKPKAPTATSQKALRATELFQGSKEITIEFNKEIYRLRITRNDKLILTK